VDQVARPLGVVECFLFSFNILEIGQKLGADESGQMADRAFNCP